MKIGRNQPCPCGSGIKYKRCCGNKPFPKINVDAKKADELIRQQQQGLGRPIFATKIKDQQIVIAGNTVYHSLSGERFKIFYPTT